MKPEGILKLFSPVAAVLGHFNFSPVVGVKTLGLFFYYCYSVTVLFSAILLVVERSLH